MRQSELKISTLPTDIRLNDEDGDNVAEMASHIMTEGTTRLSEQIHELDDRGDISLIVKCPLSPRCTHYRNNGEVSKYPIANDLTSPRKWPVLDEEATDVVSPSTTAHASSSQSSHVQDAEIHDTALQTALQVPVDAIAEVVNSTPNTELDPCARFKVSSRHLALSSTDFKAMIDGELTKNPISKPLSLTEVPLYGDDPEALLLLLYAIHGKFSQVRREVDVKLLTQLAILVDKYDLFEVTIFLKDHWLRSVEDTVPTAFNDNVLPWICIAFVFKQEKTLQEVSSVAMIGSSGDLNPGDFPIEREVLSTGPL